MPVLRCHKTVFYSQLDEAMFFDALKKIAAIRKIEGAGSDLLLSVPTALSDKSLRELLGLFFRYQIDMSQLAQFGTAKNRKWFRSSEAYWAKSVFATR